MYCSGFGAKRSYRKGLELLVIRPNEDGNVYCINNSIRLKDLGLVSSFTARKFLVAEYSELYEGMLVRL